MREILITDTSVLLNLLATGVVARVLAETPWRFHLCPAVLAEARVLRHRLTGEQQEIDCSPLIEAGLLVRVEIETDEEYELLADYTGLLGKGSDGEAMSFALAESRGAEIAIDDERAVRRARQRQPGMVAVGTPRILREWQTAARIGDQEMTAILRRVRDWACYIPSARQAEAAWWLNLTGQLLG